MSNKRNKKPSWKKISITMGLLFIIFLLLSALFQIRTVDIVGSNYYTGEELKNTIITGPFDNNSLFLYLKYKFLETKKIPFIQKLDVEMKSRNHVFIQVYEKTVIGCVEYMGEYVYFDKDGIVVETSVEKMDEIPYITGVKYSSMKLYEPLAVQDEGIFETILELSQLIKKYEIHIDKIQFNYRKEVTLFSNGLRFLLGRRDVYDEQIALIASLMPKTAGLKGEFDLKNLTNGQKNIIFKED